MGTINVEMQRTQTVPAVWVQDATKADDLIHDITIYTDGNASKISHLDQKKDLIATLKEAYTLGLSIIPPKNDGSKSPYANTWKQFQSKRPTKEMLFAWYDTDLTGIGYVCGAVSGNLECLDFDERGIYVRFREEADKAGILGIVERLEKGYMEYSPNGVHLLYRCSEIGNSHKLATRPKRSDETKNSDDKTKTLIETRGEGGYIITAPSFGNVNLSGDYILVSGGLSTIEKITPDEREDLLNLARTLHIPLEKTTQAELDKVSQEKKGTGKPGDDFNERADWHTDVLHGWTVAYKQGEKSHVRKPGKTTGVSGTINLNGNGLFHCFTTSTEFEQKSYTKFGAYAVLHHSADFSAAAKELAAKGYGGKSSKSIVTEEDFVWDTPLLFGKINTPEIPLSLFPSIYGKFGEAVSKSTQTPSGLAAMFLLSTLATCLQGKFVVSPSGDSYVEPMQLWTLTALPPASRKTAVLQHILRPIISWEAEMCTELKSQIEENKLQRDVSKLRIEQLKTEAGKCKSDEDRELIFAKVRELIEEMPEELRFPRVFNGDCTSEGLQKLLNENIGRMSILTDEGGIFEVMAGLYSNGKVNIDVFLKGHAGSPIRVDRAGRTLTIDDPSLTFGLAVQPDVVKKLSNNSKGTFRGNGCLARFLWCIPESNIGKRDVRKRVPIPNKLEIEYCAAIKSLLNLPGLTGEDRSENPLVLDAEALNEWFDFSQRIENEQGSLGSLSSIQDWSGKLPGATLRIAGLFHLAEFGTESKVISVSTIRNAIKLSELLIDHAKAAFDMIGTDPEIDDAKFILQWLLAYGKTPSFKRNDLHRALHGKFTKIDRLDDALKILTERHIISEQISKSTGHRPIKLHYVNPSIFDL